MHYLLSTPSHPIFTQAATARAAAGTKANGHIPDSLSAATHPDPRYPLLVVFPSELFSVSLLFPHVLCDADLSRRFNILALDPRGHGLTREVPPRKGSPHLYDLDTKTADCLAFLDEYLNAPGVAKPQGGQWQFHIVACGMSGLVATRAAAKLGNAIQTLSIVSPILEVEDQFIIDSIAQCEEIINEAWTTAHSDEDSRNSAGNMPGELVEGFGYRWAGEEESLPKHVERSTFADLYDRFIRRGDGKEAARAFLFDLYFERKAQSDEERARVTADLLVVEGSEHLPYEEPIGGTLRKRFPNARSFRYEQIQKAPFLLSVMRPLEVRDLVKGFILPRIGATNNGAGTNTATQAKTITLSHAEMHQLRLAFTSVSPSAPSRTLFRNGSNNSGRTSRGPGDERLAPVVEKMERSSLA